MEDSDQWRVLTNKMLSKVSSCEVSLCRNCREVDNQGCYNERIIDLDNEHIKIRKLHS